MSEPDESDVTEKRAEQVVSTVNAYLKAMLSGDTRAMNRTGEAWDALCGVWHPGHTGGSHEGK